MRKIVIYALSTCPWCRKARQFFTDCDMPFECIEYDLADDSEQKKIARELGEYADSGFPIVRIGDEVIVGYNPDRYKKALKD